MNKQAAVTSYLASHRLKDVVNRHITPAFKFNGEYFDTTEQVMRSLKNLTTEQFILLLRPEVDRDVEYNWELLTYAMTSGGHRDTTKGRKFALSGTVGDIADFIDANDLDEKGTFILFIQGSQNYTKVDGRVHIADVREVL